MTKELSDGDKVVHTLQSWIDEAVVNALQDVSEWADDHGMDVDFEWEGDYSIRVGNEQFDIEYKVVRKPALEKY